MTSKLFDARNKLTDIDALKKYLDKSQLSHDDYLNLMRAAFEKNRQKFVKIVAILKTYDKSILESKLDQNPLFIDICRIGTADDVHGLLELQSLKVLDLQGQSMYFALQNDQKKHDKNESLEIVKVLFNADPQLVISLRHSKPVIAEAIERQKFQVVSFLLEKGVDVSYQSHEKDNLLHLLMRNFIKKYDKIIESIRIVLVERGVDEKRYNSNNKKPYQLCPPDVAKRLNQDHRQHMSAKTNKGDENIRYENKFRQGELSRVGNTTQYRQKIEKSTALSFENKNQLQKQADRIFERITKEKQKQMPERDKQKMKEKDKLREKEKKEKINKRVFSPDELKHFLNEEINYFVQQIDKQNKLQKASLDEIIDKITKQIKSRFKAELNIFGSFATELCLTQSDIDMVIIPQQNEETSPSKLMQDISNFLLTLTEDVASIKFIKTASIPIIKIQCTEKYAQKTIDITCKDENHNGLSSVTLIKSYLVIYPQLRPLVFVLKKFMYSINLCSPYSGGLSSYGLILMIVAFLQNLNREKKSRGGVDLQKSPSTAQILIGFLEFYGFKCNYISKKICILKPETAQLQMNLTQLHKYQQQQIYMDAIDMDTAYSNKNQYVMEDWQPRAKLVIIDPLNKNNNIGRATHKIREIKTAFEMAYVSIHTNKNCKNKRNCQSYQRISNLNLKDTNCDNYQRPCCIIKRMLNSTNSLIVL